MKGIKVFTFMVKDLSKGKLVPVFNSIRPSVSYEMSCPSQLHSMLIIYKFPLRVSITEADASFTRQGK